MTNSLTLGKFTNFLLNFFFFSALVLAFTILGFAATGAVVQFPKDSAINPPGPNTSSIVIALSAGLHGREEASSLDSASNTVTRAPATLG